MTWRVSGDDVGLWAPLGVGSLSTGAGILLLEGWVVNDVAGFFEQRGVVLRHRLARLRATEQPGGCSDASHHGFCVVSAGFRSSGAVVVVNDASVTSCDSASTLKCLGCSFHGVVPS